ncbi:MAG: branched-chain amino acid ABC transporter ATP-binding protein [Chloroflexi bacterium RBG_16_54_11]|nr:MAG: branched-chain amino acid ABC transporter ATP-binding protein [Chloroflexi bacterium RBG_16_54_11]
MPILEIRDLVCGYGEVQILWGTNIVLEEGKLTCLVGANGAGKTTLLHSVMGLNPAWKGAITFEGRDITHSPAFGKADLGLVLVPEGRQLFTDMSVYENLEMGATNRRAQSKFQANLDRVFVMFPRLKERRHQNAGTLSGGEQQMLAVSRGIMADPRLLMIDELSLGLAPVLVLQLFETLKQLKKSGITVLLVEQNVQMALAVSGVGYVLAQGRIELHGPARQLIEDKHVREAYLGL